MHFLTAMGLIYLYHAYQRTKEDTSLLPHRYSGICILDFLSIIKGFISFSFWNWTNFSRTSPSKLSRRIQRRTRYPEYQILPHPDIGEAALDRQLFTYLVQPIALVPACLNYLKGYRRKLRYSGHQMLPNTDIGDAALDRQLFTNPLLKQLKNKMNLRQRTMIFTDSSSRTSCKSSK